MQVPLPLPAGTVQVNQGVCKTLVCNGQGRFDTYCRYMDDDKYISVFSNGEVWISANMIRDALESVPVEQLSAKEIVDTFLILVNKIDSETYNAVAMGIVEKSFKEE